MNPTNHMRTPYEITIMHWQLEYTGRNILQSSSRIGSHSFIKSPWSRKFSSGNLYYQPPWIRTSPKPNTQPP